MKRVEVAKRLGAPIELCIHCLKEFLGPEGIKTANGSTVEEIATSVLLGGGYERSCCSLACAIEYGKDRVGAVIVSRNSDGAILASRKPDEVAWSPTGDGLVLMQEEGWKW